MASVFAMMRRTSAAGLLLFLIVGPAAAHEDGWAALKEPGTHVLLRHAIAPGTGDPDDFKLGDCATQRNLNDRGRAQASAIGEAFRANAIAIDLVLTSQWCRARDTAARLGVARIEDEPALNSFFEDRANAATATNGVLKRLAALPAGTKAALVTHQVNITALTDVFPSSGEMVVIALSENGAIEVRGRMRTP